jgi:hypothetical protein
VLTLDGGEASKTSQRLPDGLGETLSALTLAGLILYGVALLGYRAFYGRLGIEPEEAGLGYTQILAQAAFGATFFLIVILASDFFEGGLVEYFTQDLLHRLFAVWSVITIVFLSLLSNGGSRVSGIIVIAMALISGPLPFLYFRSSKQPSPKGAGRILIFYLVILVVTPVLVGRQLANDYIAGEEETPIAIVGMLHVNVKSVTVSWIGDDPPWAPTTEATFLCLGQSNGMVTLYDRRSDKTYRLPIGSVAISDKLP